MIAIEKIILRNLQYDVDFARKTLPYLKGEYFSDANERIYFSNISSHYEKYNSGPDKESIMVDIQGMKLDDKTIKSVVSMAESMELDKNMVVNKQWLLEQTEEFCKNKSLYLALMESINVADGNSANLSRTAIPEILSKALSVSFDTNIGHDYIKDTDRRFDYYNRKVNKIKFHLDSFNKITDGGVEKKTINCVIAGTGVGKSIWLCDLAAHYITQGLNVLYITLEMSEEKIAQRVDANLLNVNISDIQKIPKLSWDEKITKLKEKCSGKLIVKEYPTSSAHAGHFRFLCRELQQKQNFIPDIIIIDYINICASQRYKNVAESYGYMKGVTEELRGLAVETNTVLWSALQFNRGGINNSDADMTNTGESMGIVHTLDFLFALIVTEQLISMGQVLAKQLKTRYGDITSMNQFVIGLDRTKMKFYELTNNSTSFTPNKPANTIQHKQITQSVPVVNNSSSNTPGKGIKV